MSSAARYLRLVARRQPDPPRPAPDPPLTAAELQRALAYAREVRAPKVAVEAIRAQLDDRD